MSEVTIHDLHAAMGDLLDLLADVPGAHDAGTQWTLGGLPAGGTAITVGVLRDPDRTVLAQVSDLLGGGEVRPYDRTYPQSDGQQWRLHVLHAEYEGVPVLVTVTHPEPDERTALLARLAELDAADALEGGGDR